MPDLANIATIEGLVMDVPHSKFNKYEHIQIFPLNSPPTLNQQWTIVDSEDDVSVPAGFINIFAGDDPKNHLCLDIPDSSTTPGTLIQLFHADQPGGDTNQQWKLIPAGDNQVYIASALNENLVIQIGGAPGDTHALIQIDKLVKKQSNQIWSINLLE